MPLPEEAAFSDRSLRPPCQAACPINQDVRGYLRAIAWGESAKAQAVIRETNPLPSVCGTICARPCESECRRGQVDQPLSIRALKRFAMEHGGDSVSPTKGETGDGRKVAIIGSGPAGLTAAHDLARLGYSVTIFEREEAPGGALRTAVPLYRLPREVLERDIAAITALGVEIETNRELGNHFTLADLKNRGYQAILISVGLPLSRALDLPGSDLEGVSLALPFLRVANFERKGIVEGKEVIVIGGGNVAVDAARCALRLGAAKVRMVCLEAEEEIPAFPWEIEEAGEEGIEICCSRGPRRILSQEGRITGLECIRCEAVFDSEGRFNPSFCEDEVSVIEGDAVIIAIGQAADLSFTRDSKLEGNGRLVFDPDTLATAEEGVFVAGEIAIGPGTAVEAMASGRKAALSIHRYLKGETTAPRPPEQVGELAAITIEKIKRFDREKIPALTLEQRRDNFDQIDLGYGEGLAVREARRCLNCGASAELLKGKCSVCLNCVRVCPYGVPIVTATGAVEIQADQCQACGICLAECPAKAIAFPWQRGDEVFRKLETAVAEVSHGGPVIIGFCCSYGPYALSDFTAFLKKKRPPNLAMVRLPCTTMVDTAHLLRAFELGAEGVFVAGCLDEDCPYQKSSLWAKRRVDSAKRILAEIGLEGERLEFRSLSASEVQRFDEFVAEIGERVKSLSVPHKE